MRGRFKGLIHMLCQPVSIPGIQDAVAFAWWWRAYIDGEVGG